MFWPSHPILLLKKDTNAHFNCCPITRRSLAESSSTKMGWEEMVSLEETWPAYCQSFILCAVVLVRKSSTPAAVLETCPPSYTSFSLTALMHMHLAVSLKTSLRHSLWSAWGSFILASTASSPETILPKTLDSGKSGRTLGLRGTFAASL